MTDWKWEKGGKDRLSEIKKFHDGAWYDQDDVGLAGAAIQWLIPEVERLRSLPHELERRFHKAGFMDIWYAHPGPHAYDYYLELREKFGGRWHAGVFTGPQHDLICVKQCETNEEAERYLSPGAHSIAEAIEAALAKREDLG